MQNKVVKYFKTETYLKMTLDSSGNL